MAGSVTLSDRYIHKGWSPALRQEAAHPLTCEGTVLNIFLPSKPGIEFPGQTGPLPR